MKMKHLISILLTLLIFLMKKIARVVTCEKSTNEEDKNVIYFLIIKYILFNISYSFFLLSSFACSTCTLDRHHLTYARLSLHRTHSTVTALAPLDHRRTCTARPSLLLHSDCEVWLVPSKSKVASPF